MGARRGVAARAAAVPPRLLGRRLGPCDDDWLQGRLRRSGAPRGVRARGRLVAGGFAQPDLPRRNLAERLGHREDIVVHAVPANSLQSLPRECGEAPGGRRARRWSGARRRGAQVCHPRRAHPLGRRRKGVGPRGRGPRGRSPRHVGDGLQPPGLRRSWGGGSGASAHYGGGRRLAARGRRALAAVVVGETSGPLESRSVGEVARERA
mmetsp:Transcript_56247/g.163070  ORF Transcript_56247/g.163070 Transcript_56247/m.163070 type:complete len:208 (+) Transcript_56247:422-1045(+)